jgi:hypothetical protein
VLVGLELRRHREPEMVEHDLQARERLEHPLEQRELVGGRVVPEDVPGVGQRPQEREHRQSLELSHRRIAEVVHPQPLQPGLPRAPPVVVGGRARRGVVHADAREHPGMAPQAFAQVVVVRRQRHEHTARHARARHRGQQFLHGNFQISRVDGRDVARKALRRAQERVRVPVDHL